MWFFKDLFDKSVFKLNQDFTISFEREGGITNMSVGMNQIVWNGILLTYEVKELISFNVEWKGLCHVILPKNVLLKPGNRYSLRIKLDEKIKRFLSCDRLRCT